MSIKIVVPYFCVLREGYYVIIWLIVRTCVFINDWKLIYSELIILKRKSMENWGGGSWHSVQHAFAGKTHVICLSCTSARLENRTLIKIGTGLSQKWENVVQCTGTCGQEHPPFFLNIDIFSCMQHSQKWWVLCSFAYLRCRSRDVCNFHMIYIDDIIHNCMCVIFWTWKWYIKSSWIKWNKN